MQNKANRSIAALVAAVLLIVAAGAGGYAIGRAHHHGPLRAFNLTTGRWHLVQNPDCAPGTAGVYSGEAVCSWVNAFLAGKA